MRKLGMPLVALFVSGLVLPGLARPADDEAAVDTTGYPKGDGRNVDVEVVSVSVPEDKVVVKLSPAGISGDVTVYLYKVSDKVTEEAGKKEWISLPAVKNIGGKTDNQDVLLNIDEIPQGITRKQALPGPSTAGNTPPTTSPTKSRPSEVTAIPNTTFPTKEISGTNSMNRTMWTKQRGIVSALKEICPVNMPSKQARIWIIKMDSAPPSYAMVPAN